jgi:hypothetical protein
MAALELRDHSAWFDRAPNSLGSNAISLPLID